MGDATSTISKAKSIVIGVAIALFVGAGLFLSGYFVRGCTTKPTKPPTIEEVPNSTHTTYNKDVKDPKKCGEKVILNAEIEKGKIKVTGKDNCKETYTYFKYEANCPVTKNELGFGPGYKVVIDIVNGKVTSLVGGRAEYTRWWGNVGLSPEVGVYGEPTNKKMYALDVALMLKARW